MPYRLQDSGPDLRESMYFPEVIRGVGILMKQFLRNFFFGREKDPDVLARDRSRSQNVAAAHGCIAPCPSDPPISVTGSARSSNAVCRRAASPYPQRKDVTDDRDITRRPTPTECPFVRSCGRASGRHGREGGRAR